MTTDTNKIVCPECGKVRMETPPGTTPLPTIGMAMKAAGNGAPCGCGKSKHERPGALAHEPGEAGGPGTTEA